MSPLVCVSKSVTDFRMIKCNQSWIGITSCSRQTCNASAESVDQSQAPNLSLSSFTPRASNWPRFKSDWVSLDLPEKWQLIIEWPGWRLFCLKHCLGGFRGSDSGRLEKTQKTKGRISHCLSQVTSVTSCSSSSTQWVRRFASAPSTSWRAWTRRTATGCVSTWAKPTRRAESQIDRYQWRRKWRGNGDFPQRKGKITALGMLTVNRLSIKCWLRI